MIDKVRSTIEKVQKWHSPETAERYAREGRIPFVPFGLPCISGLPVNAYTVRMAIQQTISANADVMTPKMNFVDGTMFVALVLAAVVGVGLPEAGIDIFNMPIESVKRSGKLSKDGVDSPISNSQLEVLISKAIFCVTGQSTYCVFSWDIESFDVEGVPATYLLRGGS